MQANGARTFSDRHTELHKDRQKDRWTDTLVETLNSYVTSGPPSLSIQTGPTAQSWAMGPVILGCSPDVRCTFPIQIRPPILIGLGCSHVPKAFNSN